MATRTHCVGADTPQTRDSNAAKRENADPANFLCRCRLEGISKEQKRDSPEEGNLSLQLFIFKAPGPAVWGYGLWGSVGWDRAIFN